MNDLPHFDYVVLLDPMNPGGDGYSWWSSTLPAPTFSSRTEAYYRTKFDIEHTAVIEGIARVVTVINEF